MAGESDGKTFTQAELDAIVAERIASEVEGLKRNRDAALGEAKRLREESKKYEGLDPERARQAISMAEELEQKKLKGEGDWKALETQLIDRQAKEKEQLTGRIGTLTKALEQKLIDAEASKVIAELKGSVKGLLPHAKPHIRVIEQDGEFVAVVVDGKGNPRIADAKGTAMTIRDLVAELKNDAELGRLFEGSGSSGGGASRSSDGVGGHKSIPLNSGADFMKNIDGIRKGEITVPVEQA